MSLDGAFLHIVKTELLNKNLINSRVDKIHQPSREEIVIILRANGNTEKLILSVNPISARICLTEQVIENPKSPPMFCMLLRKHLGGGRILDITQDGLERIINFDFLCMNEIGDMVNNRLVIEIMGRASNIILLSKKENEWRVIDSIKRVTDEISSVRRILPNIVYQLPPRSSRLSVLGADYTQVIMALKEYEKEKLDKTLIRVFEGISPIFAREWAYYSAHDTDVIVSEVLENKSCFDRFIFFLNKTTDLLKNSDEIKYKPVIVSDKCGKYYDFCFINVEQYGSERVSVPYPSANALLDSFYESKSAADRLKQRSGNLLKNLLQTYERIARKIETWRQELAECADYDKFRVRGDIINANLYNMEKGQAKLSADDFETGETVVIPLDAKLSPSQNAQKYYSEYRKKINAEKKLKELIIESEQELLYIDSVFDAASRATNESELAEIKEELSQTGYLRKSKQQVSGKKGAKQEKLLPPLKFLSSDGTEILAGRNNLQNDRLTLKTAQPNDIWLHTQNIHGSHIIIKTGGKAITGKTLNEAAAIGAYCSKARSSSRVPVDYTEVRYVKKPAGAKPGMVIFTHNKTLFVTPDAELYNRLKKD